MKVIEQDYLIAAPIEAVWQALTDAETMAQWSGAVAHSDATVGGDFSLWDGDIHGTYTLLSPHTTIEQDWYGHDHPERKFTVSFQLQPTSEGTNVHLVYTGEVEDEAKDIQDWQQYYFQPIRKILES